MKLISTKALREFAALHVDAEAPLQAFRRLIEQSRYDDFAALRATFRAAVVVG